MWIFFCVDYLWEWVKNLDHAERKAHLPELSHSCRRYTSLTDKDLISVFYSFRGTYLNIYNLPYNWNTSIVRSETWTRCQKKESPLLAFSIFHYPFLFQTSLLSRRSLDLDYILVGLAVFGLIFFSFRIKPPREANMRWSTWILDADNKNYPSRKTTFDFSTIS